MSKTKISIYKIKNPSIQDRQLVKDFEEYRKLDSLEQIEQFLNINSLGKDDVLRCFTEIKNVGKVYFKQSAIKQTDWSHTFFQDTIRTYSVHNGAALIIRLNDETKQTYVVALGNLGRHIIKQEYFDEGFGVRTALNIIDPKELRQIVKREFNGSNRITQQQIFQGESFLGFDFDQTADYLKSITGKIENEISETLTNSHALIKGSNVFSLSVEHNINNVKNLIKVIDAHYSSERYKDSFKWWDNIHEITDINIIDKLRDALIDNINNGNKEISLSIPDVADIEAIEYFKFDNKKYDSLELDSILIDFKNSITLETLNKYIYAYDSENEIISEWTLEKCINAEIELPDKSKSTKKLYAILEGNWYDINKDFATNINNIYKQIELSDLKLNEFDNKIDVKEVIKSDNSDESTSTKSKKNKSEGKYLERIANNNSRQLVLMDKKLVYQIEICDLLAPSKLIHVKRYSGSSALSHLFFQGLNAAILIKSDDSFLNKANERIEELITNQDKQKFKLKPNDKIEIIYAIIGKGSEDDPKRPYLPFFSKLSLYHAYKQLSNIGYDCKLLRIAVKN